MKIKQHQLKGNWELTEVYDSAQLVLVFGDRALIEAKDIAEKFQKSFPKANVVYCTTAGEILNNEVNDNTLAVTAIEFEKTTLECNLAHIDTFKDSFEAGKQLVQSLRHDNLKHILVLADGQKVNGSELVRGMNEVLDPKVTVSGGLAGDGARFQKTLVGLNSNIVTIDLESSSTVDRIINVYRSFHPQGNVNARTKFKYQLQLIKNAMTTKCLVV